MNPRGINENNLRIIIRINSFYVVDKDSVARKKYVKISNEYQKFWVVTDGLNVGDEFISEGLVKVIADKPVVVLKDDELIKLKDKK